MGRFKSVDGVNIPFSPEEEAQRDAEEAAWEAEQPKREEERRRQLDEATKFRESIKYEERAVAFIDVLGWKELLSQSIGEIELQRRMGSALFSLKGHIDIYQWMETHQFPGDIQASQLSDSIVVSTRDPYVLVHQAKDLCRALLLNGFAMRGGITIGKMYHSRSVAFGPALLKAYELESTCAVYPRVVIDPMYADGVFAPEPILADGRIVGHRRTTRKDHDGVSYLEILRNPGREMSYPPERGSNSLDVAFLNCVRPMIETGLRTTRASNPRAHMKYVWLANYVNAIAEEDGLTQFERLLL